MVGAMSPTEGGHTSRTGSTTADRRGARGTLTGAMRYWLDRAATPAEPPSADGVETTTFFSPDRGCAAKSSSARCASAARPRSAPTRRLTRSFFVLSGHGVATIGGAQHELEPGVAAYPCRLRFSILMNAAALDILSVVVHGLRSPAPSRTRSSSVDGERGGATAGLRVPAARRAGGRLRIGDAVRRLHPRRPRTGSLPQVRRGRLRPRGLGASSTSTATARPLHAGTCVHLPALAGPFPPERLAGPDVRPSAYSARPARPPRPTTPTAPPPSSQPRRADAENRTHRRRSSGRETSRAVIGLDLRRVPVRSPGFKFRLPTRIGAGRGQDEP